MRRRSTAKTERQTNAASHRDRLAMLLALVTGSALVLAFVISKDTQFLMPGPLASAHGAIESCSTCHTKSGNGKLSWLHGLVAGDRLGDSKACVNCHRMPDTAMNAHGASAEVLKRSTMRLTKVAAEIPAPRAARAQSVAFPTNSLVARGLYCSTCHQEHQGIHFNLNKISDEQCRSCHVVQFDSFDGHHPKFEKYPFKRRTRIIYDHAGHFGKHFPEIAKNEPAKRIPTTCSSCHNSAKDKRVMALAPFAQTCAACHLEQIKGNERISGPKGIAFLALPGLDLQTLQSKKAAIGEWPSESEANLTPFMKILISRNERGRDLINTVRGLNLQDLSGATNDQIKAVTKLVWEIKGLIYALIKGGASSVLAKLNIESGEKLDTNLIADLTAIIPRDVVTSAHQQWLPNLGAEMANRPNSQDEDQNGWTTTITETKLAIDSDMSTIAASNRPTQTIQQNTTKSAADVVQASGGTAQINEKTKKANTASATRGKEAFADNGHPSKRAADQTDDLLHPTEDEIRSMKQDNKSTEGATKREEATENARAATANPASADVALKAETDTTKTQVRAAPTISIESDVDPESWAAYGGWYRQDYTIFYRPTGHKDKFIYTWLLMTGAQAPKGGAGPATAVFDLLTSKDAQGNCTKCHSVDDVPGKGRGVNFSPLSIENKQGRFTNFVHEPHLGIMEKRGCLTCHNLEKAGSYLKSYEQSNPQSFVSNFSSVQKDLCQTCHTSSKARQDCLLCHKYHVNDVSAPMIGTKIPAQ
ncbi:MAG: hypothetical protein AB7O71_10965 [Hyphomicrobiaceae bacterium]